MIVRKKSKMQEEGTDVIVFMDMQTRLLNPIGNLDGLIKSNSILAACSKILQIPTIITEQVPDKLGSSDERIVSKLVNPLHISKHTFSAFGSLEFSESIGVIAPRRLVLVGIETPICVFLTAMDALKSGFLVTVVSDCVGCRVPRDGDQCLSQLLQLGAEIIPLESFIFSRLKCSTHPGFREASNLIKDRFTYLPKP